jgi:transcriptional regulator with XRE-family HTH domain
MSTHEKAICVQFRKFMLKNHITQHGAAYALGISQPTLSKLLSGRYEHVSDASVRQIAGKMTDWMDSFVSRENALYNQVIPLCDGIPPRIVANVFRSVLQDIQG